MATADLSSIESDPDTTEEEWEAWSNIMVKVHNIALERVKGLLRCAIASSELPVSSELAPQVLSAMQEKVAVPRNDDEKLRSLVRSRRGASIVPHDDPQSGVEFVNYTPGLDDMAWKLWDAVDRMAREDERHHDVLVSFLNAFFSLLRDQQLRLEGPERQPDAGFRLGMSLAEAFETWPFETAGQGIHEVINFARFVARMTRDTHLEFRWFLFWFARDALESSSDCSGGPSVLAFEAIVDVCGTEMFRRSRDLKREVGGVGDRVTRRRSRRDTPCGRSSFSSTNCHAFEIHSWRSV